jgi:hypothetical protein
MNKFEKKLLLWIKFEYIVLTSTLNDLSSSNLEMGLKHLNDFYTGCSSCLLLGPGLGNLK